MPTPLRTHSLPGTIRGYATLFSVSIHDDVAGRALAIRPGAFRQSLVFGCDVEANWKHDSATRFASTAEGTLRLWEDSVGLAFEARVPVGENFKWLADFVGSGKAMCSVHLRLGQARRSAIMTDVITAHLRDVSIVDKGVFPTACWCAATKPERLSSAARRLRRCWSFAAPCKEASRIRKTFLET